MAAALLPCRFANAWTRLGLTQSLAELPAGLLDSPELVGSSSLATSGSLPSSSSSSAGGGGGGVLDAAAYAPGSQVRAEGPNVAGAVLGLCLLCTGAVPTPRWPLSVAASVVMPAPLRVFDAALAACALPALQKVRVEGEVLRWHHENGKEVVPALQYIEQLEAELADLRQQVTHCLACCLAVGVLGAWHGGWRGRGAAGARNVPSCCGSPCPWPTLETRPMAAC